MRRAGRARSGVVVLLGLLTWAVAGCTPLPESGPVERETAVAAPPGDEPAVFSPPGPSEGASRTDIVGGFLTAMQASPLSTSVAAKFLTKESRSSWNPDRGTLVHQGTALDEVGDRIRVRLGSAAQVDARGAWLGPLTKRSSRLDFTLTLEGGEWRIENPPDFLVVPATFFESRFQPMYVYYFDQTGRVLVPQRVFVPRGEEVASNLVRALLAGPGGSLTSVTRTSFPTGTELDFGVDISSGGTAEVPLTVQARQMTPGRLRRGAAQLQFTLRQVPSLATLRVTVDGEPLALSADGVDLPMLDDDRWDSAPEEVSALPFALRNNRIVGLDGGSEIAVKGAFGVPGFSLRSFAVNLPATRALAVASDGSTVFEGAVGSGNASQVRRRYQGSDVLKPAYDMFGTGWLVDRTPRGARLVRVEEGAATVVRVDGLSGETVRAFVVSRDGTRLVAVVGGREQARLVVVPLTRSEKGRFITALPGRSVGNEFAGGGTVLTWVGPSELMLLSRLGRQSSQVRRFTVDGAPPDPAEVQPDLLRSQARGLASSSDPDDAVLALGSGGQLLELDGAGTWRVRGARSGLSALAFPG